MISCHQIQQIIFIINDDFLMSVNVFVINCVDVEVIIIFQVMRVDVNDDDE